MPPRQPNILFIFTDQQRADTLGCLNPVMRTPTLDRLCAEGTTFTHAYTPVPVCVPARCSLLFGQYATRTGCYENNDSMPAETAARPTFMGALAQAGYQAHGIGKMHFTPDLFALRGFHSREISEEMNGPQQDDYVAWLHQNGCEHILDSMGVRGEMYYIPQPAQMPAQRHHSQWVAERSIEFLRHRDRSRPFLLWSSFIHPHPPFSPPVPWNKLYRAPDMPLPKMPPDPENFWTATNRLQNRYKYRDAGSDDNLLRVMKAYYYACVSWIDFNVGRILETLAQTGDLENTMILWSSDHGEFLGDYRCFGKRSFLKSAANIPMVVRYPERFAAGQFCSAPASLVDVMPTFLAAAGIPLAPLALDGLDLAEVAATPGQRKMVYGHYQWGGHDHFDRALYMALTQRWKYIYSAAENREFLFDLRVDPEETRNRSETLGCLDQTRSLRQAMIAQLQQEGQTVLPNRMGAIDGDHWRVYPPPEFPRDPDAGLLFQDADWASSRLSIPGYTDFEQE